MNINEYNGDPRYWAVWEKMQLLQIEDVSTKRQDKNGTIVWKLPIKNKWNNGSFIEVASFKTGYVRNNNSCSTNYQLNKRCEGEPEYFELPNGDYRRFSTRSCVLIPIEIDRLEYLISYCLKNYYIKHANFVTNGDYVPKWRHERELEQAKSKACDELADFRNEVQDCGHYDRIKELESDVHNLENKLATIERIANDRNKWEKE